MHCFKKALRQPFLCWKLLSAKAVLLVYSSRTYVDKKKSEYSSTLEIIPFQIKKSLVCNCPSGRGHVYKMHYFLHST